MLKSNILSNISDGFQFSRCGLYDYANILFVARIQVTTNIYDFYLFDLKDQGYFLHLKHKLFLGPTLICESKRVFFKTF
jgi:hypothetical protein